MRIFECCLARHFISFNPYSMPGDSLSINSKAVTQNTFDAIVIGTGMSGGWAMKELTEQGLRVLALERGANKEHLKDYDTATLDPWGKPHRGRLTDAFIGENPILVRSGVVDEFTTKMFIKDDEHPYKQDKPFDWIRGYQVGGRSLMWGRWTQRWGVADFEANGKEGVGIDWPIRYHDLEEWYSYVERFVGIAGNRDGLAQVPDGDFLPPFDMNCLEKLLKKNIEEHFPERKLIISRTANLTVPTGVHKSLGRGQCQARDLCSRGCPFGAYFSTQSATLPAAQRTGRLTLGTNAVVHSIIYDEAKQKATGVRAIDADSKQVTEYFARVIFLNAGSINSNLVLLNSTSKRFPNGLGNDSGVLGHYIMAHNYRVRASGTFDGLQDSYYHGRRPNGVYMPRFRNFGSDKQADFKRGYALACFSSRQGWGRGVDMEGIGSGLKDALTEPGPWTFNAVAMGEMLPYEDNRVWLDKEEKDAWGIPLLHTDVHWHDNEDAMAKDAVEQLHDMFDKAGLKNITSEDNHQAPGKDIHEMGGCRMGNDPGTSMLNKWNQMHAVKNVFVTDGACMTSSACQNPSLTYMAITARAAHFAVGEMKKGNL
jgi:choline dehydrogenase-like flavoprotein